jgi:pilus assembly protein Flp/PilA
MLYFQLLQAQLRSLVLGDRERGATAVEYGLLVAAIAAVIVAIVFTLGGQIQAAFQTVSDNIANKGKTTP